MFYVIAWVDENNGLHHHSGDWYYIEGILDEERLVGRLRYSILRFNFDVTSAHLSNEVFRKEKPSD